MVRINNILNHQSFKDYVEKNMEAERERIFCGHDLQHFIDVARVGYILSLEEGLGIEKEIIYATALLHDIGRWKEYVDGTDHAVVGVQLARGILEDTNFDKGEIERILSAIGNHRNKNQAMKRDLDRILYQSDKIARPCRSCEVILQCKRFAEGQMALLEY